MTMPDTLERGRDAARRRVWREAFDDLTSADRRSPLVPEDLERLAVAAHMLALDDEQAAAWTRAYQGFLARGDTPRAVRCAFSLAMGLLDRGDIAQGGGWLARANHDLEDAHLDCVEQGFLLLPAALQSLMQGDASGAYATFGQAMKIGDRFGDRDLMTLGRLGRGRALIELGETTRGLSLFDHAMVAVTADEVSPIIAGIVYCAVIEACHAVFDFSRAREWTSALTRWCASQPDMVPYRGQCLVHRTEVMQLRGAWLEAIEESERACQWLSDPPQPAAGAAFSQRAELHRLRGESAQAEADFRTAGALGFGPQPGLALLRLAQGRIETANAAIRRLVDEPHDRLARPGVLAACVEVMLAVPDLAAARSAAEELAAEAADLGAPFLLGMSGYAVGAVRLAEGDARGAANSLQEAVRIWRELEAPYEVARGRALLGRACRALGDLDAAEIESEAARRTFSELGAAPDLDALGAREGAGPVPGRLTARELQVLALVATGRTNRAIATDLVISEKTVARHISNIFTKLEVSSRSAATAFAYEHGLA